MPDACNMMCLYSATCIQNGVLDMRCNNVFCSKQLTSSISTELCVKNKSHAASVVKMVLFMKKSVKASQETRKSESFHCFMRTL